MSKTSGYSVVLFRVGSGCGYRGTGKTKKAAYATALLKAGEIYLSGIAHNGERFGPDIRERLDDCFNRAAKAMSGWPSTMRSSASDEWNAASVKI
jgi:hypothetical protein